MSDNFRWTAWYALVIVHAVAGSALATLRDFTVITEQSNIAASGTVTFSGATANIQPQATGSLTTNYSGTIVTDREENSILFKIDDVVSANVNGNWIPDANAANNAQAADYGGKVIVGPDTVNVALRQLAVIVTSGDITLDSGGHFDLSAATLSFASGKFTYRDTGSLQVGNFDLSGGTASLTGTGSFTSTQFGAQTIEQFIIPINSTFVVKPNTSTTVNLTLTGQIFAAANFTTPLPGDYNLNGVVDFADYNVWRNAFGAGTPLANDDTAGVEMDDYVRWRAHYGQTTSGSGTGASSAAAVPEPCEVTLVLIAGALAAGCRRRA